MSDPNKKEPRKPYKLALRIGPLMILGGGLAIRNAHQMNETIARVSQEGVTGSPIFVGLGWALLALGVITTLVGVFLYLSEL